MRLVDLYETDDGRELLYQLLKERDDTINISHQKMPTMEEHLRFVESRPYQYWYLIIANDLYVGAVYLSKNNEIGVGILKKNHRKGYGKAAVLALMAAHPGRKFLANINPRNLASGFMFRELGFSILQVTFSKEG